MAAASGSGSNDPPLGAIEDKKPDDNDDKKDDDGDKKDNWGKDKKEYGWGGRKKDRESYRLALPPPLRHIPNIKKLIDIAHKPNSIPIHTKTALNDT